jgi:hypothetical protein
VVLVEPFAGDELAENIARNPNGRPPLHGFDLSVLAQLLGRSIGRYRIGGAGWEPGARRSIERGWPPSR